MRRGRIAHMRRAGRGAKSAQPERASACGAASGAGRTIIGRSTVELSLAVLSSSLAARAVEDRQHLGKGPRALPMTCAAEFKSHANPLVNSNEYNKCVSKQAKEAAQRARWGKGGLQCSRMRG